MYLRLKIVRAHIGEVPNLAEIHDEMSELLGKQVNVQKENLKMKPPGFTQAPASPLKACDENERNKQSKKENKTTVV